MVAGLTVSDPSRMDITPAASEPPRDDDSAESLTRRGFLRVGVFAGGGIAAVALAACELPRVG